MLGVSLYGVGNFDDANRVFLKSLTIIRNQHKDYASVNSNASRDNKDHHYTAGKVLNNIGCGFYELGFYKSATRSFHRSLLIYMNGANKIQRSRKLKDEDLDYSSTLSATLNSLRNEHLLAKVVPQLFIYDVTTTLTNLAYVLVKRKKYLDASICLKEILVVSANVKFYLSSQ